MTRCFAAFALMVSLFACSSAPVQTHYYTLHAKTDWAEQVEITSDKEIGIGPLSLPESLEHPGLMVMSNDNQLRLSTTHLWAGDLKKSISRTIADNISTITGSPNIWAHPWDARLRPNKQVIVVIERLQGPLGGALELQAKWRWIEEGNKILGVYADSFVVQCQGDSYGDFAVALNQLINQLSLAIVRTTKA